jgi:uncharacterized membrane protein YphA (DoxX/SURF4 family)
MPAHNRRTRYLTAIARIIMGLLFLVMGLNGFLNFLPQPAVMPPKAAALLGGFVASGYMLPLLSTTQVVVALMLLSNRFVPLALAIIAPVVVNIAFYHAFIAPDAAPLALLVVIPEIYLAWFYRSVYRPMLAMSVDVSRPQ